MKPVLQAILLAERVYDTKTNQKVIAGTFNRIYLNRTGVVGDHPTDSTKKMYTGGPELGSPFAYVSLTDLIPEVELAIRFVDVSKNATLFEISPIKVNCQDRLATVELVAVLPPLVMFVKEPGTYSLDLIWNEELLGSHRIVAQDIPEKREGVQP